MIEALAEEFAGRARIVKVEIAGDGSVLEPFGAHGVPAYVFFRDGVRLDRIEPRIIGWNLEKRMRRLIEAALAADDEPS